MVDVNSVLTQREQEIMEYRAQKLPFTKIGELYGISKGRASQIYHAARKKIREEERRQLVRERNKQVIQASFTRGQLYILKRGLAALIAQKNREIIHTIKEMHELTTEDPVYIAAQELMGEIDALLLQA